MILSPEQQTVFDWLNTKLALPVFAEAYKGAWQLLATCMPGYITLVAHISRDLMNFLAPTLLTRNQSHLRPLHQTLPILRNYPLRPSKYRWRGDCGLLFRAYCGKNVETANGRDALHPNDWTWRSFITCLDCLIKQREVPMSALKNNLFSETYFSIRAKARPWPSKAPSSPGTPCNTSCRRVYAEPVRSRALDASGRHCLAVPSFAVADLGVEPSTASAPGQECRGIFLCR